jgi:hypothetical protein
MFQVSVLFPQCTMLRSPDVAGFPFVAGSMQTVMTPLWMPGDTLPLADAREAIVPNATRAPTANFHPAVGNFAMLFPLLG